MLDETNHECSNMLCSASLSATWRSTCSNLRAAASLSATWRSTCSNLRVAASLSATWRSTCSNLRAAALLSAARAFASAKRRAALSSRPRSALRQALTAPPVFRCELRFVADRAPPVGLARRLGLEEKHGGGQGLRSASTFVQPEPVHRLGASLPGFFETPASPEPMS